LLRNLGLSHIIVPLKLGIRICEKAKFFNMIIRLTPLTKTYFNMLYINATQRENGENVNVQ